MRVRWKLLGLAGLMGVTATGVVIARKRRAHRDYDPDELRKRLHSRLADVSSHAAEAATQPGDLPATNIDDTRP
jgi:hypothetical protein